jgi:hypothetical protein
MSPEQKRLIAEWMRAWAIEDDAAQERLNKELNALGLWAYESGHSMPTVGHWYNGEIKPGMRFAWNPEKSDVTCKVTRVTQGNSEPFVWCLASDCDRQVYNEESHFRSMVVPIG